MSKQALFSIDIEVSDIDYGGGTWGCDTHTHPKFAKKYKIRAKLGNVK